MLTVGIGAVWVWANAVAVVSNTSKRFRNIGDFSAPILERLTNPVSARFKGPKKERMP
jgi:hypothetical protein